MLSNRRALAVLAAVVLVVAVAVGLWPHSIPLGFEAGEDRSTTMSCGSALSPDTDEARLTAAQSGLTAAISGDDVAVTEQELVAQCGDAVATPRLISLGLGGVAVLTLLFLALTGGRPTHSDEDQDEVTAEEPSI